MKCDREGCYRESAARGLCRSHYESQRVSKGFCAATGCNEAPYSKYGGYCLDHQFLVQAKTRQLAKANIGEQFYDAISSMIANGTLVDDELLNLATRWRQVVLSEPA